MRKKLLSGVAVAIIAAMATLTMLGGSWSERTVKAPHIITLHTGKIVDGQKAAPKTYRLAASDTARVVVGRRVPFLTSTFRAQESGSVVPLSSYTYQNVGFSAEFRLREVQDGQIHLTGAIEDSSLVQRDPDDPASPPIIETVNHQLSVVLTVGEPLESIVIENPDGESFYMDIGIDEAG